MASLAKFHYSDGPFLPRVNVQRIAQPKPISYRIVQKPPPCRAIRASSSSSSNSSFLKTTCVTITTAAALFSASLHLAVKPATAAPVAPPPPSTAADLTSEKSGEADQISMRQEEEAALEKHLVNHPNDMEALQSLMKIKFQSKNLEQALEILNRLIEINPEEHEWKILKAQVQTYGGDFDSAAKGFEEILAKDPFRVEAYHGLVMTYSESESKLSEIESRINEAIEKCKKENKKEDLRDFMLLIAQIRVIKGNPIEALKVYEELVKEEPKDFRPYLCQGLIYTLMKKKDEAEKQFEEFRRLVPENHPYKQYFDANLLSSIKLFPKNR